MPESSWLGAEREYFVTKYHEEYNLEKKFFNKVLRKYNMFLQKALFNESPFVADDLKLTIEKAEGNNGTETRSESK